MTTDGLVPKGTVPSAIMVTPDALETVCQRHSAFHGWNMKWTGWWWNRQGDVKAWRRFSHYWPFVRGIHRSLVVSPHKGLVMLSCFISVDVSLIILFNKQPSCRWFAMLSAPYNVTVLNLKLQVCWWIDISHDLSYGTANCNITACSHVQPNTTPFKEVKILFERLFKYWFISAILFEDSDRFPKNGSIMSNPEMRRAWEM